MRQGQATSPRVRILAEDRPESLLNLFRFFPVRVLVISPHDDVPAAAPPLLGLGFRQQAAPQNRPRAIGRALGFVNGWVCSHH